MSAKQKVRAEVGILLPAMTRDVRRVRDAEASPQFSFVPRIYFLNGETGHCEVGRRRQACPKSIAVEVGSIVTLTNPLKALTDLRQFEKLSACR
jgi:hypothetical protein